MIEQLARDATMQRALTRADAATLLRHAIEVQQIPAPTFHEAERAAFVKTRFAEVGLADVEMDAIGNVYARQPGRGALPPVLLTAHTDTVFPADTDLSIRREGARVYGPGLGDNSLGVAALLYLPELLAQARVELPGDLWLVANVAEEGMGDLRGMRSVMDRLGSIVLATIIVEGLALGRIYHQAIAVRRYCVRATASGGHSWLHHGQPSAIHALVQLASELARLEPPSVPRTTLNIGRLRGGTSVNTIAREAEFELDLRSEADSALSALAMHVERIVGEHAADAGAQFTCKKCGDRPSGKLPPDHPLVQLAVEALQYVGQHAPQLDRGSTDANIPLSRGYPAITVGLTQGGNTHRPDEYIDVEPLRAGLQHLLLLVAGAYRLPGHGRMERG